MNPVYRSILYNAVLNQGHGHIINMCNKISYDIHDIKPYKYDINVHDYLLKPMLTMPIFIHHLYTFAYIYIYI